MTALRVTHRVLVVTAALAWLAGCGDSDIQVYEVPKDGSPTAGPAAEIEAPAPVTGPQAPVSTAAPAPAPSRPTLSYTLPEAWTEGTPGRMVLRAIDTPQGAKLGITRFPGDVGGLLANVNRWWVNQLGQSRLTAEDLPQYVKPSPTALPHAQRVTLDPGPNAIVVEVIAKDGYTWFFKLMGSSEAVANAMPGYDAFMQSVQLDPTPPAATP
ncbi:MAG: hypothetical protein AAGI68_07685 [Planctomycetota bacterium]